MNRERMRQVAAEAAEARMRAALGPSSAPFADASDGSGGSESFASGSSHASDSSQGDAPADGPESAHTEEKRVAHE